MVVAINPTVIPLIRQHSGKFTVTDQR